ncbi:MAG: HupE/UreJ family protein, partial [Mucilaginibacter sp.]
MRKYIILLLLGLYTMVAGAHPMPSSVVKLSVLDSYIKGEAKMPLPELESAIGTSISGVNTPFFRDYFTKHIAAISQSGAWQTTIQNITTNAAQDVAVGKYRQVVVQFTLTPAAINDLRKFTFNYDAIIHQVVTHSALIFIEQDWSNGIQTDAGARQIGIIKTDIVTGKLFPLQVNLQQGSAWKGFVSMVKLGMQHIKEGTDHLLFLLVLLLPAMVLPLKKRWGKFGGLKYSCVNLLKIVTAFTVGHSCTLLLGAMGWVKLPGQPVEVLIAVSIVVSAAHAIYPIFPRREVFVAGGFGLVHGLAFATVLANLDLGARQLVLSVLGF